MPTYAYQCTAGHRYDLQQPFGSPKTHRCKRCNKKATRVVAGAAKLVFKGSGFYKTDSRNGGSDTSSSSSSSSSSSTSSSSNSSSSSSND